MRNISIAGSDEVAACYRLLLGREPDPQGLAHHVRAGISVDALVAGFLESPEFRQRSTALKTVKLQGHEFLVRAAASMYEDGDYEPYVFGPLMSFIQPGKTFLDIGANIGVFSIHAARRGARVIAVEAKPSNAVLLLANAQRAGVSIELHPLAASDRHGYAVLEVGDRENGAVRPAASDWIGHQIVACGLLDELIRERPVDVLKIDVEGHEFHAMRGARRLLERSRPVIITEYAPDLLDVSGTGYLEFLQRFGYSIRVLERNGTVSPAIDLDALCRTQGYHADLLLECVY